MKTKTKKFVLFLLSLKIVIIVIFLMLNYQVSKKDFIELNSRCSCRKEKIIIYEFNKDHENTNCDLFNVLRRGYGQKIVSYSLYGTKELYYKELKYLSELVTKYYPTWTIRIYYDDTINSTVICEYECLKNEITGNYVDNIDFCNINEIPFGSPKSTWNAKFMHSMKWRFLPIGDPFVDMFMSRDLDGWIHDREVDAVKVWFNSSALFHVMRGGMWGYGNYRNRDIGLSLYNYLRNKTIAKEYKKNNDSKKGKDQDFLGKYFWPIVRTNAVIQDSYLCTKFGGVAFPTQRPDYYCFVSCAYCCDKKYNQKWKFKECPKECRPINHQNWSFC